MLLSRKLPCLMVLLSAVGVASQTAICRLEVRLVGRHSTSRSGRVEVRRAGSHENWGTVCDDNFGIAEAHVVCRMLGFRAAEYFVQSGNNTFGAGSGPIYLDDVNCAGTESSLDAGCSYNGWSVHNCGHGEDVGVTCQDTTTTTRMPTSTRRPSIRSTATTVTTTNSTTSSTPTIPTRPTLASTIITPVILGTTTSRSWWGPLDDPRINCISQDIEVILDEGQTEAHLETQPRIHLSAEGQTNYTLQQGCAVGVTVTVTRGISNNLLTCPENRAIPTNSSETDVNIEFNGASHTIRLPLGTHQYRVNTRNLDCVTELVVYDERIVRSVVFRAQYQLQCSHLTNNISRSMILTMLDKIGYIQIEEICQGVCTRPALIKPKMTCAEDLLTVDWLTNLTFNGSVTEIPESVMSLLLERIDCKGSVLGLFVLTAKPPVVYPLRTGDSNRFINVVLISSCANNQTYSEATDSCIDL